VSYKVCIPTAGIGSRLGGLTRYLNKSLVAIANRPTICHLIEQFPPDTRFVIALGYKASLVQEFLGLAYPDRYFDYAHVDPYEGAGSGLGLSLLKCRRYLQEPFIFISCDTLVDERIPPPNKNWMGYADMQNPGSYRTLEIVDEQVIQICEKGVRNLAESKPYIGLAGIADYKTFWSAMELGGSKAIQAGEAHGLRALLSEGIEAKSFTWHDTGNIEDLNRARKYYQELDEPNILEKENEAIWFVRNHAIKFSEDRKFIANRVKRAEVLSGFVPAVTGRSNNMYRYAKADGQVFSEVVTLPLFQRLLTYSTEFWKIEKLNKQEITEFKSRCMSFYRDKTFERVGLFYKNFSLKDSKQVINGMSMPLLKDLLEAIDWDWISNGLPGRFHGDFHFENILWSESSKKFIFLDWRQDFGGGIQLGDIYYDLAKLLHGLVVSHELIAKDLYSIDSNSSEIRYSLLRKQVLVECEQSFTQWLENNCYDAKKVRVITALIFLNIAALHHYPYCLLLFSLGKSMLKKELES